MHFMGASFTLAFGGLLKAGHCKQRETCIGNSLPKPKDCTFKQAMDNEQASLRAPATHTTSELPTGQV